VIWTPIILKVSIGVVFQCPIRYRAMTKNLANLWRLTVHMSFDLFCDRPAHTNDTVFHFSG